MDIDYAQLGLKAGLEIHQQLDTKRKLFCNCPTIIRDDNADIMVKRRLRASAGETGETDVAAVYEQLRGKQFLYRAFSDTTCNVELDEEPVRQISSEALDVGLQVALLLKAQSVDCAQVMRKTVVDGSNTSGFQRTVLIARNGEMEINGRRISIPTICLEEESAKISERSTGQDTYNLSRLGIPLVEIATGADLKSPQDVKDAAEYLGMVLRSTGKVKRGLGTIRQDVNVSIKEGARVEIKGAQDLRLIPKLVEFEALRQKGLADVSAELRKRGAAIDGKFKDVTASLANCESNLVKDAVTKGRVVLATKLSCFKGLIGKVLEGVPRRLGMELSEYAKSYAGVGGILHADELPKYGITLADVERLNSETGCKENDAFVLVVAEKDKAEKAIKAVIERARTAIKGVHSEVRKANEDGTTSFLRPMPGSSRMYPETDHPMITLESAVKLVKAPRLLTEKAGEYEKIGLTSEIAKAIIHSENIQLFEELIKLKNLTPSYIADVLLSYAKQLAAEKIPLERVEKITDNELRQVIEAVNSGRMAKESVIQALKETADTGKLNIIQYSVMTDIELESALKQVIEANKGMPFNALIGKAMEKLRGKAPGQKIAEKLKLLSK